MQRPHTGKNSVGSGNSKEISTTRARVRVAGFLKAVEDSGFSFQCILMHRKVLIREGHYETVRKNSFKVFNDMGRSSVCR